MGSCNYIGKNVVIGAFKGCSQGSIHIGDCNFFHDNTRILMGPDGLSIGDWNVFHNNLWVMGEQRMEIGHNCWFGQNAILDSAAGLFIGNGVRVGMYSQVWTHAASGELLEGCTLFVERPTYLEDDAWLFASCIVASGLRIRRRSICLAGSNLTKDTEPGKVYGGSPAKHLKSLNFWREVSLSDKTEMMLNWARQFAEESEENIEVVYHSESGRIELTNRVRQEQLIISGDEPTNPGCQSTTYFNLATKTYTKRLTLLERQFYKYLFGHKARFIPDTQAT